MKVLFLQHAFAVRYLTVSFCEASAATVASRSLSVRYSANSKQRPVATCRFSSPRWRRTWLAPLALALELPLTRVWVGEEVLTCRLLPQETADNDNTGSDLDQTGSQVCERVGSRLDIKQSARVS